MQPAAFALIVPGSTYQIKPSYLDVVIIHSAISLFVFFIVRKFYLKEI